MKKKNGAIVLSRRNLLSLLVELELTGSAKLHRQDGDTYVEVRAEEDQEHYGDRKPGRMHPTLETLMEEANKALVGVCFKENYG